MLSTKLANILENLSSIITASSHSGLIPLKTANKKKRGIAQAERELEEFY